jgi:hypothetical protein
MKMEQTECSETSAYKIQKSGNYPEENIQHTEQGEGLKLRILSIASLVLGVILIVHYSWLATSPGFKPSYF